MDKENYTGIDKFSLKAKFLYFGKKSYLYVITVNFNGIFF